MVKARKIGLDTVVEKKKEVVCSEVDGETVVMSIQSGKYFGLKEIGSRIWTIIDHPSPINEICDALMVEYDVAPDQCHREVLLFMEKLWNKDLIKVVDQNSV